MHFTFSGVLNLTHLQSSLSLPLLFPHLLIPPPLAGLAGPTHVHVYDVSVLDTQLAGSHVGQDQLPVKPGVL